MTVMHGKWWTFLVRGICAVLFGLLTFLVPGMAAMTLILLFGTFALVEGVLSLFAALRAPETRSEPWWELLAGGVLGLVAGVLALVLPGRMAIVLLYVIAGWAMANGIMTIFAAIQLRKQITGEFFLALSGVLSLLFGVFAILYPGAGVLTIIYWIGVFALLYGGSLIALGLRLRQWMRIHDGHIHGMPMAAR